MRHQGCVKGHVYPIVQRAVERKVERRAPEPAPPVAIAPKPRGAKPGPSRKQSVDEARTRPGKKCVICKGALPAGKSKYCCASCAERGREMRKIERDKRKMRRQCGDAGNQEGSHDE